MSGRCQNATDQPVADLQHLQNSTFRTPAIVTLLTDFGWGSSYVAAMKGVILTLSPTAVIVDITHAIPPQDVRQGALILAETAERFPQGTIHVAVVDPGVGSRRELLWAEINGRQYLAPDNGLLSLLAARRAPTRMRALTEPAYWLDPVSATFHGRDILAPVAARLTLGLSPESLGPARDRWIELEWPEVRSVPGKLQGSVTRIDSFGNLITDITADHLAEVPRGEATRVSCGDHETFGIFRTYSDQPEMTLIALIGSSGLLELAIVGDSAAIMLGEAVGAPVTVRW